MEWKVLKNNANKINTVALKDQTMGHPNRRYITTLKSISEGMDFGPSRKYTFDCHDCVKLRCPGTLSARLSNVQKVLGLLGSQDILG